VVSDLVPISEEALTPAEFQKLADVPPELEWLANISTEKTRRFYKRDVEEFSRFTRLRAPVELRNVTRAHVIARRKSLEARNLTPASIRRKLSALSSLYGTVKRGGHHQGPGMARPLECVYYPPLRPPKSKPEDSPTFHVKY
jgi:hypothetical protein